jgi:hypothetical protein
MNWHEPRPQDKEAEYNFVVEVFPDIVPYQVASDGDAYFELSRPGWGWVVRDVRNKKKPVLEVGTEETREAALVVALAKLGEMRS